MPNFVDCAVFYPVQSPAEKQALRTSLALPPDAFIVGCVAAVKKDHKRIDYLIHEFALYYNGGEARRRKKFEQKHAKHAKEENGFSAEGGEEKSSLRSSRASVQNSSLFLPYLLIAGAKTSETAELFALAESLIPGRYKILTDCSRARMPELLRAMDVFVLTSLFEMMPIALLEALASGLPCVVNKHPVLEWMVGAGEDVLDVRRETLDVNRSEEKNVTPLTTHVSRLTSHPSPLPGGMALDMSRQGALAQALAGLTPEWIAEHGRQARARALNMFSTEAVIGQYVEYYKKIVRCET
jgi:glycosyltransferase involved in cell wall biosynthesis